MRLSDIDDLRGRASAGFRGAVLSSLRQAFAATAPEAGRALEQFGRAAQTLRSSEGAFNSRARPASRPSLLNHLRDTGQMAALREFSAARDALVQIHPLGETIVRLTQKDIDVAAQSKARPR